MRVPDVDLAPLADVLRLVPEASVQILNARPNSRLLEKLAPLAGVFFDTARVEGTDGVPRLVAHLESQGIEPFRDRRQHRPKISPETPAGARSDRQRIEPSGDPGNLFETEVEVEPNRPEKTGSRDRPTQWEQQWGQSSAEAGTVSSFT